MEWLSLALKLGGELFSKLPDYDERQKKKFFKLKKRYMDEVSKDIKLRDDNLLSTIADELRLILENTTKGF